MIYFLFFGSSSFGDGVGLLWVWLLNVFFFEELKLYKGLRYVGVKGDIEIEIRLYFIEDF